MLKFLGPFKKYVRFDGREKGYSKNMRKRTREGELFKSIRKPMFV